jgi:hypothetical protein
MNKLSDPVADILSSGGNKSRKVAKIMEMIKLRTGKSVPVSILKTTMESLHKLAQHDIVALYDLVELCESGEEIFWEHARKSLLDYKLIQPGDHVNDHVRDIVLATVKFGTSSVTITDLITDSE